MPAKAAWAGRRGGLGQALAMLALLGQILLGMLLPGAMAAAAPMLDAGVICHSGGAEDDGQAPPHSPATCALCPACLAVPAMLAPVPAVVPARLPRWQAASLPPARAGPPAPAYRAAAQPRGPPASV